jgi:hypothetical protein
MTMSKPLKDAVKSGDENTLAEASDGTGRPKPVAILEPGTRPRRRATGPRTAIGKQRSRLNAQTHRIFSKGRIVGDESAREFEFLLQGLLHDLKPEGVLETLLVDQLATILWRKRRILRAEAAEIENAQFETLDTLNAYAADMWDRVRSGEATGGMLKHQDNPYILREALLMLKVRCALEERGSTDPWILRRLYGLDHQGSEPFGTVLCMYLNCSKEAADNSNRSAESPEDLKKKMLEFLDQEINRVQDLLAQWVCFDIARSECNKLAALVPPPAISERLLRYETHLSREFDRTLSQLERLQRMRLGQPVLPPISVRLSG